MHEENRRVVVKGRPELKPTIAKAWTESRDKNPMGDMGGLGGL